MKRRLITVMMFALVAAAVSSTLLFKIISANSGQGAKPVETRILVATRDLNAGALVGENDVRESDWPGGTPAPWIRTRQDVVGRGLLSPVGKDEPFSESRLAAKGAGAGITARIPPGMRVAAVRVDEQSGIAKFLLPGTRVDVISTATSAGMGGPEMFTRTILQNIELFSTGQNADRDAKEKPAAVQAFNLLVTPEQAEILSQAVAQTRIQLVLRNPADKGSFLSALVPKNHVPSMDVAIQRFVRPSLATQPKPFTLTEPAKPTGPTVEIIHGTKKVVMPVSAATEQGITQ